MFKQLKTIREKAEFLCYQANSVFMRESGQTILTALTQLEAMVGEQEPVAWQRRMKPVWGDRDYMWSPWEECSEGAAKDCWKTPLLHEWAHEARALYTSVHVDQGARVKEIGEADLDPDEGDPVTLWAEIWRLREALKGPDGYATWQDAATAERILRVRAENKQAAPVAQQPQARPDFTDEWTGYLKDGETPFERFLRERKDMQSMLKLYQRVLEENERLKAQQPQAEPDIHEAQGQIEFLDKKNNALSAAIRKVMARLADLLDEDQFKEIEETISSAGVQPQAEAVPLTHVLVPVDEPTDEMVDAACAAVDGLCRVDFVRAYVAAFAHLKAGYRDESYWCGWNAAIKFQQAEAVPVVDRVYEAAKRLVDHADFQLGGVLSAKSKARDIPSNAASKVKARHLASLRDALAKTPQQAEAVPPGYALVPAVADFDQLSAMQAEWNAVSYDNTITSEARFQRVYRAAIAQQKGQP